MKKQILDEQLVNKIRNDISSNNKKKLFNNKIKTPELKKISLITYSRNNINIVKKNKQANNNYKIEKQNKSLNSSFFKITKKILLHQ